MPKGSWLEFNDPSTSKMQRSQSIADKAERHVRVQRLRGGKGGKTVTVISGLELDSIAAKSLLKRLKTRCGTGGTLKADALELQGDQVSDALELLRQEGYRPKKSGG
ncbi:translation initiation factor [Prochlorococcus sp. MIT 1307]|uniref:translation initiation factor n=1 Tax=Prochlorococcus sp. MIT 1307 TaxID=3096219 RepID=UPI002A75887C|nr:translation initiation factor [Prochlorococcus sp. MIT 1307]